MIKISAYSHFQYVGFYFHHLHSKWGFVCDCSSCSSELDDDLLTATAKLEADIRGLVTSSSTDKDWARIAGWQDQVSQTNSNIFLQFYTVALQKISFGLAVA